jgi:hypothetical protein
MSRLAQTDHRSVGAVVDHFVDQDLIDVVLADRDWVDAEFDALIAAAWSDATSAGAGLGRRGQPAQDRRNRPGSGWPRARGDERSIDGRDPRGRERAPPHGADVPLARLRECWLKERRWVHQIVELSVS